MEYYQELREFQNSLKNLSDTITAARVLWNDENYAQLSQSVIEVANMSRAVVEAGEKSQRSGNRFHEIASM